MPRSRPISRTVVTAVALLLLSAGAASAATVSDEIHRTLELRPGGELVLENINGTVEVEAWDRAEVDLRVVKTVKARSQEKAEKGLAAFRVEIDARPDRIHVEAEKPRNRDDDEGFLGWLFGGDGVQYSASYTVKVPRRVVLDAATVNGRVVVTGTEGPLEVSTVNGRVELADVTGTVEASSVNGSVKIREARGSVSASTTNGSIAVAMTAVAPQARMEISTVNGSVSLDLPADVQAHLDARSTNGGISTDFPVEVKGRWGSKSVNAELNGGGGGELEIRTVNGGIRIHRL